MDRKRLTEVVVLVAALLWQLYVVVYAYRHIPDFAKLFAGLGGPLPLITRSCLATYKLWGLLPLLFAALSADVLRRRNPSPRYLGLVLIGTLLTALGLQVWLQEAMYAPLLRILDQLE